MRPGEVIADRFVIERLAGAGGMGSVFRAMDRTSGRPVAVKLVASAGLRESDRFLREARALAELSHPRIVGYVAHGVTPTAHRYLAMEWLDGEDLAEKLRRGPIPLPDTLVLAAGIAEALTAAHNRGVVHRDVKPGNLFLPDGDVQRVKVLDFGLARLGEGTRRFSRSGLLMGTPGYVAPEQARGARDVGPPADLFALGCVLFECLTGRAAFVGEHVMAVLAKILLEDAPRVSDLLPDIPHGVDDLVARLMAKMPEDRPQSGSELSRLLPNLVDPRATPRTPSGRYRQKSLTRDERRLVSVVVAGRPRDPEENTAPTISVEDDDGTSYHQVRATAEAMGVRLERLADGSLVAALEGRGNAADQAGVAARCAIAMRSALPGVPLVLATGRGVLAGRLPVGDVIDGAVKMLRQETREVDSGPISLERGIRLDQVTAGLLGNSFEVELDAVGLRLRGERRDPEAARLVLGKPTPCVGRERELAVLEGLWDECVSEPVARAVLVTAPAGVGKSRLRIELLRRLREKGKIADAWIGRADTLSAGATYSLLAPIVRAALGINRDDPAHLQAESLWNALRDRIGEAEIPRVGQFLAELAGISLPAEDTELLRIARRDPVALGDQVRRAWDDFLAATLAREPVLIVLEDLHWGDLPTVKVIDATLRAHAEAPLLILALARPEVHDVFPKLWEERALQEIRLGELSRKASERLVRQVLGEHLPAATVDRLVTQAAGHAFFLEELMRAEAETGGIGATPSTIVAMLQTRLEGLDSEPRRVLRAASILGGEFSLGALAALLDAGATRSRALLVEQLEHLVDREVLARAAADDSWAFRHALVREAAYAMLTEVDRTLGHRLAAEWTAQEAGAQVLVVAEHFERGGQPARAAAYYQRAAAQLLTGNDLEGAIRRAVEARALGGSPDVVAAAHLVEAEAHYWRAAYEDAETHARAAMERLPAGDPRWYGAAGVAAAAAGNFGRADTLLAIVSSVRAAPAQDWAARALALARIATYLVFAGHLVEATSVLAEAASISTDDAAALGWRAAARGVCALGHDSGHALEHLLAAVNEFDRAGDLRNAALQRINAAFAMIELGAYRRAEKVLREAIGPAERMGLANVLALAENNLGLVLVRLGKLAEAITLETDALHAFEQQGDSRLVAASNAYLALAHQALGERQQAEACARAAVAAASVHPPTRAYALAVLADLRREANAVSEAVVFAREAHELLLELGSVDEGEAFIRLVYAEALVAAGRPDARNAVVSAYQRLIVRSEQIADPEWRKVFLEGVPENVRTRALAERI